MADLYTQVLEYFRNGGTLSGWTNSPTYTTGSITPITSATSDVFHYSYNYQVGVPRGEFKIVYEPDYRADGEMIAV